MIESIENKLNFAKQNPRLFEERKVLDKGFVRLVDWMGDDSSIAKAARVSYGKGTKSVNEDSALIDYLIRHQHTSPIEMVEFIFHIKLPLFSMAQLVRHRTSSLNQVSARYSIMEEEFYVPEMLRVQSKTNKQSSDVGSLGELERYFLNKIARISNDAYEDYEILMKYGVAREMARMILPQNLYTQVYWKQDLKNLLHLLRLRMDEHAQYEIRVFADAIYDIIRDIVPNTIKSWENHILNSVTFSSDELELLEKRYTGDVIKNSNFPSKGRNLEFEKKIKKILGEQDGT
jgi:thymidylate synthase (FAD)